MNNKDWRQRLYVMVFQADTPAGRRFDTTLLLIILCSLVVVVLDSIDSIHRDYADLLAYIEWGFTFVFAVEYGLRLYCSPNPCVTPSASMGWWTCWRSCPAFWRFITATRSTC
jgi:hypothetical protein